MDGLYHVSSSPHVRDRETSATIMYDVAIALAPAALFGIYRFGIYAALILLVSVGTAILSEYMFEQLTGQKVTVMDGSALVTGLLLGLCLPPKVPLWIPALGSLFAVVFVKQFFGGLGQNFMNPALAARCFLLISFAGFMGDYAVDSVSGATPLALLRSGKTINLPAAFLGFVDGCIGEVSVVALLLGAVYLLWRKVITLQIPLLVICAFLIFEGLFGGHGFDLTFLASQLCSGGLILGAFFMATDYVTSPITKKGKIVYAVAIGLFAGLLRTLGSSPEGMSYAIIITNMLVPLIERWTKPTTFGYGKNALVGRQKMDVKVYKPMVMLVLITAVAGMLLGVIYEMTKGPIEEAELKAKAAAYAAVCPDAAEFAAAEDLDAVTASLTAEDGTAADGQFGLVVYDGNYAALDAAGNVIGYVVNVTSKEGFGGDISVSVGISSEKEVTGLQFLSISETAGLGMNATKPEFYEQYVGKAVDQFELVKGDTSADNEISALSGASFTSNAVTNAVNAALYAVGALSE